MFADLKDLNTAVKNMGNFLFDKQSRKVYQTGIQSANHGKFYLDSMSASGLLASTPSGLVIGEFEDSTVNKYLLVVNRDFSTTNRGTITLKYPAKVSIYDKSANVIIPVSGSTGSISISLPAGEAALYIIE